MARTISLSIDLNDNGATQTVGQLEERLEQLNNELREVEIGSDRFRELTSEIARTTTELKNVDLAIEGLDREQRITATTDSLAGLAGGVTAVVGTFAALGIESEVLSDIETRVIGLIGVTTGIADAGRGLVAFNKLLQNSTTLQRIYNAVAAANPYIILAAAIIGTLTAIYFLTRDTADEEERLAEAAEKRAEELDNINSVLARHDRQRLALLRERGATQEELVEAEIENLRRLRDREGVAHNDRVAALDRIELLEVRLANIRKAQRQKDLEDAQAARDAELQGYRDMYAAISRGAEDFYKDIEIKRIEDVEMAEVTIYRRQETEQDADEATLTSRLASLDAFLQRNTEVFEFIGIGNERLARISFQIQKAQALASIALTAPETVQNAFTTAAKSPITLAFPAYPYIAAGAAGVFSAAQFAAAAAVTFDSPSVGPTNAPSAQSGIPSAAALAPVTSGPQLINELFVSADSVTDGQNISQRRRRRRSISR